MPHTTPHRPYQSNEAAEFLRLSSVVRRTGLARSTIYRLIAERKFPLQVKLAGRAVAWRSVDLDRWSAEREPASR